MLASKSGPQQSSEQKVHQMDKIVNFGEKRLTIEVCTKEENLQFDFQIHTIIIWIYGYIRVFDIVGGEVIEYFVPSGGLRDYRKRARLFHATNRTESPRSTETTWGNSTNIHRWSAPNDFVFNLLYCSIYLLYD